MDRLTIVIIIVGASLGSLALGYLVGETDLYQNRDSAIVAIGFWTVAGICLALFLYMMRREARITYGLIEVIFGSGAIIGSIISVMTTFSAPRENVLFTGQDKFTAVFILGAAIYVLVRGLDNVGEGLAKYPRAKAKWDKAFPPEQA